MGFSDLIAFAEVPQGLFQRNDDDLYDRMNHRWTTAQLIVFALLVTMNNYVGDPIHCWVPSHFHGSWAKYTNSYCWMRNTYYLPFENEIGPEARARDRHPIIYYQWVSMILLVQALMFYMPMMLWRALNGHTGMDMNDIIEATEKLPYIVDQKEKTRFLTSLAESTHRYLNASKPRPYKHRKFSIDWFIDCVCCKTRRGNSFLCGKRNGNYITVLYVVVKLIFLANVIGQLWTLNFLLGHNYANYGVDVLKAMYHGDDWTESKRFPRVTMCDIDVRRLGNHNIYTVQCVLVVNFFNEKIFLYLWWWFLFVAIMTFIGLVLYLFRATLACDQRKYIESHVAKISKNYHPGSEDDRQMMEDFIFKYLRSDGVLLTRLIGHNTTKATVSEYIDACYEHYINLPEHKDKHGRRHLSNLETSSLLTTSNQSVLLEEVI